MTSIKGKAIRAYRYAPMPGIEPSPEDVERFISEAQYVDEEGEGFLVGAVYPFHMNADVLIGGVLMMDGCGSGKTLLDRFERWAKENGASLVCVTNADLSADTYFAKRGYEVKEHMHMRSI